MTSPPIGALTDQQAITVLALVLDRDRRLPDPIALRELDTQVAAAVHTGIDRDDDSGWAVPEAADSQTTLERSPGPHSPTSSPTSPTPFPRSNRRPR